uniref:Response regulator receiver domain-containing protein n=1 Tax=Candidatus Kentrum sp. UNK TaxID=2126344 RepID=A0A451AYE0_9GAMM|nr:MAG: Response regulator receiver domain-containing protein [Candidatus Kentron sp. UNK]VFK71055.1 MAG: Response regulator receiver domain-containing protein [Candidatus Kentron sp. UNK]
MNQHMKYLIIDDMREHIRHPVRILRDAKHEVKTARSLDEGWQWIQDEHRRPFDLVILDLALDKKTEEFTKEQNIIWNAMRLRHLDLLPSSGQAMGLRLWRKRREMRQRYCYMTNNRFLWRPQLDKEDPEFEKKASEGELSKEISDLILEKSSIRLDNVAEKFEIAHKIWDDKKWLE